LYTCRRHIDTKGEWKYISIHIILGRGGSEWSVSRSCCFTSGQIIPIHHTDT
jgi:hypothetical protein